MSIYVFVIATIVILMTLVFTAGIMGWFLRKYHTNRIKVVLGYFFVSSFMKLPLIVILLIYMREVIDPAAGLPIFLWSLMLFLFFGSKLIYRIPIFGNYFIAYFLASNRYYAARSERIIQELEELERVRLTSRKN